MLIEVMQATRPSMKGFYRSWCILYTWTFISRVDSKKSHPVYYTWMRIICKILWYQLLANLSPLYYGVSIVSHIISMSPVMTDKHHMQYVVPSVDCTDIQRKRFRLLQCKRHCHTYMHIYIFILGLLQLSFSYFKFSYCKQMLDWIHILTRHTYTYYEEQKKMVMWK